MNNYAAKLRQIFPLFQGLTIECQLKIIQLAFVSRDDDVWALMQYRRLFMRALFYNDDMLLNCVDLMRKWAGVYFGSMN